eukprot:jgi/Tetstr1/437394/TSEL_026077.t1
MAGDEKEDINKQRANLATDKDEDEGGNGPVHDARAANATEHDDGDDCGEFIDPCDWEVDDLARACHDILPPLGVRRPSFFKPRRDEANLTEANKTASYDGHSPSNDKLVAERLIYSRVFNPAEHECFPNVVVDGLLAALEDKRLENKDKAAREKRDERERREAEAKNKNDKGDKSKGLVNE